MLTNNNINILDEAKLYQLINEELTKTEITSLINSKIDSKLSSSDLKKKIQNIAADIVEEFFKTVWQRSSFWKSAVKK